ncbi:MAG: UDP-3-O-acyl-N-acetylglucosamine deacetylase, partial [bacterium]|nr:UDP-3-O-acyl-N-acetylglucosamine deacetylase [bacterium]
MAKPLSFSGKTLFSGKEVEVVIEPAPEDYGLVFVRRDLNGTHEIPVHPGSVLGDSLGFHCTVLGNREGRVYPVEHLLAVLYSSGVSNARILVPGEELPFMDGSAQLILEQIRRVGTVDQNQSRQSLTLQREI